MKERAQSLAQDKFTQAITNCGLSADSFEIANKEDLVTDPDYYSFLLELKIQPFSIEEEKVNPPPIPFQIDYHPDPEEIYMIVGEDSERSITSGNVFSYLYFNSLIITNGSTV